MAVSTADMEQVFIKAPIYSEWFLGKDDLVLLTMILNFDDKIDCYCIHCGKHSTFSRKIYPTVYYDPSKVLKDEHSFIFYFKCAREDSHEISVYFVTDSTRECLIKAGQFPSMVDLTEDELSRYKKILGPQYTELRKAVGLYNHKVGIGSFVYLRRIFEGLIEQAHKRAIHHSGWQEKVYHQSRMDKKIEMLKGEVPEYLYKNYSIYSILSLGVHELKEDDCIAHFPIVKNAIEIILDQKIALMEQNKKISDNTKALQEIQKYHSKKQN